MTRRPQYPKTDTTEADIQATIIDYLRWLGFLVIRVNQGMMQPKDEDGNKRYVPFARWTKLGYEWEIGGISDVCALRDGVFFALEIKDANGRLTEKQRQFLDAVRASGGVGEVIRSLDDLVAILETHGIALNMNLQ